MKIIDEIIGWYGAAGIVIAYAAISFQWLPQESMWYQLLNVTGALGIVYISLKKHAYQPGVLNMIWATIALIALFRLF
jgi:hypothetical protein